MHTALTFFYHLTIRLGFPNYGVAIILLTVAIKVLLFPLTVKQVKSMRVMKELGPQMKGLQEKHKDDKLKLQKEIADLYKKAGVNPLAGCLPLLIQMPFLTGIFFTIRDTSYVGQPSFLWISNLAGSDPFYILPVLAAITTFVSSQQTMADSTAQNRMMLLAMPLFIGFMTLRFPAGLGLYWVVSNLVQIVQQWFLYRKPAVS
ncbi:YidC/Oxa1 family membrane protein insertase [Anaeroselena agilis]|uniref:YidC/Oxa1 family membrane protein insertase n=1 Tax=Anaeroselena agilis TaxID=3063788 RepID=A0ABU3P4M5_9FIRM|nr:YidC/Oxa1 family membrane protein insertase [Selenomonadales bacterium 4137-cl]